MVQRKVINKLGIQVDNIKHEKCLANQDGKNKGADLKKKMKKSRSIKLSDVESLKSSALKNNISQPGKPPPLDVQTTVRIPEKQPLIKTFDGSPNYMKPTSCSDAKKEQSQVNLRNSQVSSYGKITQRRNSNTSDHVSVLNGKPEKKLAKSSSLKLMRTLTKTPTFKLARASTKISSRMALCADMNVQRTTCSSTLKNSKFPAYLTLNPGGTEFEGISETRVCPYTYCSLNGHHHTPLPPLKSFLSARRRSVKKQKIVKVQALSPRKARVKEVEDIHLVFDEEPARKDEASAHLAKPSLVKEEAMNFFIEIYAKSKEDDKEQNGKTSDSRVKEAALESHIEEQVVESMSDRSLQSEIDSEEYLERYSDTFLADMEIKGSFPDEEQRKDDGRHYPLLSPDEEIALEKFGSGFESSIEMDDSGSEATDMDWQEGKFYDAELVKEANNSSKFDDEPKSIFGFLLEIGSARLSEEPVIKTYDVVCNCSNMILVDDVQEELSKEESPSIVEEFEEGYIGHDYKQWDLKIQESRRESDRPFHEVSYTDTDSSTSEEDGEQDEINVINIVITSTENPLQEQIQKPRATSQETAERNRGPESEIVNQTTNPEFTREVTNIKVDPVNPEDDETSAEAGEQFPNERKIYEAFNESQEIESSDTDINVITDEFAMEQDFTHVGSEDKFTETKQDVSGELSEAQTSDTLEAATESDEAIGVLTNKYHISELYDVKENAESSNSDHDIDDKTAAVETQDHLSDGMQYSNYSAHVQNLLEENQGQAKKSKAATCTGSKEQGELRLSPSGLSQSDKINADSFEVENTTGSDESETFIKINNISSDKKRTFLQAESDDDQELFKTCKKWKGQMTCKSAIKVEEPSKFNPREPNHLPLVPDPEAEKVDLKHQMMDERKNTEEWMVDYALQQVVSKLAPARKKKVALLVEAFETVMPVPKYESHIKHPSASLSHARTIQAYS